VKTLARGILVSLVQVTAVLQHWHAMNAIPACRRPVRQLGARYNWIMGCHYCLSDTPSAELCGKRRSIRYLMAWTGARAASKSAVDDAAFLPNLHDCSYSSHVIPISLPGFLARTAYCNVDVSAESELTLLLTREVWAKNPKRASVRHQTAAAV